jgi:metacaspase-1
MCFKKIWESIFPPKPTPAPVPTPTPEPIPGPSPAGRRTGLLFAINNYPGSQNDLQGCLNDQSDVLSKVTAMFPDFKARIFLDSQVTRSTFLGEIKKAITALKTGDMLLIHYSGHGTQIYDDSGDEADGYDEALYLYDGALVDDELGGALVAIPQGAHVVCAFDSCFSSSVTRATINQLRGHQNRFHQILPVRHIKRKRIGDKMKDLDYIVFSGCGESQTSADAYINGRYNGAFTYYWLKALQSKDQTYKTWYTKLRTYLPSKEYDQIPDIDGQDDLLDHNVFSTN